MPGTRYSPSFDRACVEDSASQYSPMHFGIESWQEASLPGNLPLNGSYKHYARSASTDSLDSSGTGTTSTGSDCGAGYSQQVSMEAPRTVIRTPMVNHNPWQFVKVKPLPLYKKAVDQMKLCEESKLTSDFKKEEEEQWQKKLDSWKSRRKKVTEKTIQRVEDLKLLEQEESQRKSKTKTFSEIVENRAQKPRCYNLSIHGGDNERLHLIRDNSCETNNRKHEDSSCVFETSNTIEPSVRQNNFRNQDLLPPNPHENSFSNSKEKFEILDEEEEDLSENPKEDSAICMEEDCESCGRYTVDLGFEGSDCSQLAEDIQDISSELSLNDSGDFGKHVCEYELNGQSSIKQEESRTPDPHNMLNQHLQDIQRTDCTVLLSMRLRLSSDTEDMDFGFTIREENGSYLVDELKHKGVGMQSGLRLNDRILAINEKNTSGRSRNSLLFSMKLSVYHGYLDLLISRSQNQGTKENGNGNSLSDSVSGEDNYSPSFLEISQGVVKRSNQIDEILCEPLNSNKLNTVYQPSLIFKEEPEPRITKETRKNSAPSILEKQKLSSPSFVAEKVSCEKELEKKDSSEGLKFLSPKSDSQVAEKISCGGEKTDSQLYIDSRLDSSDKTRQNILESDSPASVFKAQCVQSLSERLSLVSGIDDTQQKKNQNQPPESESVVRSPKILDDVKEENGLMIIFHSNSLHNQNDHLRNGLGNEPVIESVSEKKMEHDVLRSPRNVSEFDLGHDNNIKEEILPANSPSDDNSSQDSNCQTSSDSEGELKDKKLEISEELDSSYFIMDPNRNQHLPSEEPAKQITQFSETKNEVCGKQPATDPSDDRINNYDQIILTNDANVALSRVTSNEQGESGQCKQRQTNEKADESLLEKSRILNEEEERFKDREESLSRRKKEIESEMKSLLWEEYTLQKEKEEYRRQFFSKQRNSDGNVCSSETVKLSHV